VITALEPVGLQLERILYTLSFTCRCLVRGNLAGHVVLRHQGTPITVFLVPDERLIRQAKFENEQWSALLTAALAL
jgi:hypothetical protein